MSELVLYMCQCAVVGYGVAWISRDRQLFTGSVTKKVRHTY